VLLMEMLTLAGLAWFVVNRVSWGICAAVTFVVLALGVHHLQPAYNRQYALRDPLRTRAVLAEKGRLTIACYPQRWDSVNFYQPQADVSVYTRDQRRQLLADLQSRPRTLLLAKSGKTFEELLRDLPDSVEFAVSGRPGLVTAGWVRPRPESLDARNAAWTDRR
jgi:hypothetical protein